MSLMLWWIETTDQMVDTLYMLSRYFKLFAMSFFLLGMFGFLKYYKYWKHMFTQWNQSDSFLQIHMP